MLTDPQRYNGTVMHRHYDAIHAQIEAETALLALPRWIDASGYRTAGYAREVTLQWSEDPDRWVTELQQPVSMRG